jgi:hypothetical protein
MTGDHHGRGVGRATLLVRAVDAILGTHSTEVPVSGSAAGAALLACWQQRPGVARVAAAGAAATFAVHAVREAIYLSPGHGSEEPATQ